MTGRGEWDWLCTAGSVGDHMWTFTHLCYTSKVGLLSECSILAITGPHSLSSIGESLFIFGLVKLLGTAEKCRHSSHFIWTFYDL